MAEDFKSIMSIKGEGMDQELIDKIARIKENFLAFIPGMASEYDNKIPFSSIKEKTGHPYQLISDVILTLIMEKKLTGFINDGGTEALDDDILIIRENRYLDTLKKEYTTGYAE